jgi:hypothetical protein
MTIDEVAGAVVQFSLQQRIRFMARLSCELTVAARETYIPGTEEISAPRQLRAYNEMQHRVAACLWELLNADTTEVWTWSFLTESPERYGSEVAVAGACERAFRFVAKG